MLLAIQNYGAIGLSVMSLAQERQVIQVYTPLKRQQIRDFQGEIEILMDAW